MNSARICGLTVGLIVAAMGVAAVCAADKQEARPAAPAPTAAQPAKKQALKPGRDRWPVKTGSDPDAGEVGDEPVKATVEMLLAIPRPVDLPLDASNPAYQDRRLRPAETTIWTVEADVIDCRLMPDGDYRVTIRGASGKTMVLEMPNPDLLFVDAKSRFASGIKAARAQFDSRQQPESVLKEIKGHAVFTGIGYFARAYGKSKAKSEDNLLQLHPLLGVEWLEKPTPGFAAPPAPAAKPDKAPAAKSPDAASH